MKENAVNHIARKYARRDLGVDQVCRSRVEGRQFWQQVKAWVFDWKISNFLVLAIVAVEHLKVPIMMDLTAVADSTDHLRNL